MGQVEWRIRTTCRELAVKELNELEEQEFYIKDIKFLENDVVEIIYCEDRQKRRLDD